MSDVKLQTEDEPRAARSGNAGDPVRAWYRRPGAFLVGILMFLAYYVIVAQMHLAGFENLRRGGDPFTNDFIPFYAASLQVRREPAEALYNPARRHKSLTETHKLVFGDGLTPEQASGGFSMWMHPPSFIVFVAPLASLPYLQSMVWWLLLTAVPYLAAIWTIIRDRTAWAFALAAPTTLFNMGFGQTGFLTAGFIGLGLSQLATRPALAGLCIGLASIKPHFGVLIPLALLLGRHWKAFVVAAATVLGMVVASALIYGMASWSAFFGSFGRYFGGFGDRMYTLWPMSNIYSTLLQFDASNRIAWGGQVIAMLIAVAAVVWAWRGAWPRNCLGLQSSVLCFATLLFVPMVYLYDLALMVPGMAWLWMDMRQRGTRRWESALLAVCFFGQLPLLVLTWGRIQLFALVLISLLVLALTRLRSLRIVTAMGARTADLPGCAQGGDASGSSECIPARQA